MRWLDTCISILYAKGYMDHDNFYTIERKLTFHFKIVSFKELFYPAQLWVPTSEIDHISVISGYDSYFLFFSGPNLKTLCKIAVIQYSLEQSGLPHDIRSDEHPILICSVMSKNGYIVHAICDMIVMLGIIVSFSQLWVYLSKKQIMGHYPSFNVI